MDNLASIDIENDKWVISEDDVDKLSSAEGCHLKVVTEKVLKLDDYEDEASDGETIPQDETPILSKWERMKREFISIVLNVNKDPIKPGSFSKFTEYRDPNDAEVDLVSGDKSLGIHRMFDQVGDFEEYLKKNPFEEVSPGRVYKWKRVPGVELLATDESLVIYNCALWTEKSKEPFDSTWMRRSVLITNLSTDSILPGLHELLLTMKSGELCEAMIRPEAAFGVLGAMPRIAPNATIFCILEVVKIVTKDKLSFFTENSTTSRPGLSFEDYYAAADEARCRGNYYYEQDQFRVALQRYKSAIRLLENITYKDESEERKAKELLVKLYNNTARTANALGMPRLALSACKQASEIDDRVPKTYWHRMSAWIKKGHLDRALGVARRAIQLFPDQKISGPFHRAAEDLKLKIQKEQNESNELQRLMGRALLSSA